MMYYQLFMCFIIYYMPDTQAEYMSNIRHSTTIAQNQLSSQSQHIQPQKQVINQQSPLPQSNTTLNPQPKPSSQPHPHPHSPQPHSFLTNILPTDNLPLMLLLTIALLLFAIAWALRPKKKRKPTNPNIKTGSNNSNFFGEGYREKVRAVKSKRNQKCRRNMVRYFSQMDRDGGQDGDQYWGDRDGGSEQDQNERIYVNREGNIGEREIREDMREQQQEERKRWVELEEQANYGQIGYQQNQESNLQSESQSQENQEQNQQLNQVKRQQEDQEQESHETVIDNQKKF